jgi:hypothetical protein
LKGAEKQNTVAIDMRKSNIKFDLRPDVELEGGFEARTSRAYESLEAVPEH